MEHAFGSEYRGWRLVALRILAIAILLLVWFWTQGLLARREAPVGMIGDRLLALTGGANAFLNAHPPWANALLVVSSGVIDALGIFLLFQSIVGPTIRPFFGLLLLMILRQLCQGLVSLPAPEGMIWRNPGIPSLLVTYGTSTDLFFSGHTAIAVYGAVELSRFGGKPFRWAGVAICLFEVAAVIVLRAHYTMDVFAGAVTALWVATISGRLAPYLDRALARACSSRV